MDKTNINNSTPMEDMTIGGTIYNAGNSREVKTGDWRSMKPILIVKNVNNVDYAPLFVQKMQFQLEKI